MRPYNVQNPPRTIMEVYKSLPEGTLAELIDGILYMSPAPNPYHQRVSRSIFLQLHSFVTSKNLGEVFYAPIDIYLDEERNAVQPDLVFLASEGQTKVSKKGVDGPPELIVEIISPNNTTHDMVTKKALYERFGVKEYWIVEPNSKETTGFLLKDGIYKPLENGFGQLHSSILDHSFSF